MAIIMQVNRTQYHTHSLIFEIPRYGKTLLSIVCHILRAFPEKSVL
jgi:hypothetical protein